MNRRNRRAAGPPSKASAKASSNGLPASASAACEAGFGHLRAGRYLDAQIACQQALAKDPDHADSLHLMGLLSGQAQNHDLAVEWIARAIRQDPKAEYLSSLGGTLRQQGRFEEALKAYDKTVQLRPDDTSVWINLGNVLADLDRLDDALLAFQHALKLNFRHSDAAFRCGFVLDKLGRYAEALTFFHLSDALKPNQAPVVQMRAMVLQKMKRFEEALPESLRAYELDPGRADTCNNIGAIMQSFRRDEEALVWFDKALALQPHYMPALTNKANSLQQFHRFDEAAAIYRQMRTIDPGHALAEWDLALIDMRAGNFETGWAGREARWRAHKVDYPKFPQPMWLGQESIAGKTILICSDEGLGDSIQFARYVPMVAARGARVILVVDNAAYPLLSALPGVSESFRASDKVFPAFDMHCPTSSLPLAFGTRLDTIPADIPYLPAPAPSRVQAWEDRLGPRTKLRVGLVWSGNPNHGNDHNRSVTLQTLSRILDVDASFVSLQKGAKPADQAILAQTGVIDLTSELTDFNETAALIACLDLVITVDTSVAHLAGAMGCPTWILLPYTPDYRWLLDRDDSPWYPTVRLFRQTAARDYAQVLDRVRAELLALCAEQKPAAQISSRQAPDLTPDNADSLHRKGLQFLQAGQYDHALLSFEHVLKLDPRHQDAAYKSGVLLHHMGRLEESIAHLDLCDALLPNHAPTLQARAHTLFSLKRFEAALAENRRAHTLDPGNADTCNNIGACLQSLGREQEALSWFDRALDRLPNATEILNNKALMLSQLRRFDEAFALYDQIRARQLNDATTDWNLALLQMLTGNFEAGWAGRESRWRKSDPPPYPKFSQPMWLGKEPVDGKTILVHVDEGAGDTIQFVRYLPMLAERGARVILVVERHLHSLMSGLPGIEQCLSFPNDPLPAFDMHCPIGSLPLVFSTRLDSIPSAASYLPSPAEARVQFWEARLVSEASLGPHNRPRVGLVWSGNPSHRNDVNRSTSLQIMSRILDVDATFVSLQKDPKPDDRALLAQTGIIDFTSDLTDFNETAALIACLDLVITVDTSVAHLAGAMGCPTWILLPYTPDYRWLLDRDDSPWYPTVRLFRQTAARDYAQVLDRVRAELAQLCAQRNPDAQISSRRAPDLTPDNADSLHLKGLLSSQAQNHDLAVEWFARAIRQDPKPEYLSSLGGTLRQQGRFEEALKAYDKAVQIKPEDTSAWLNLGTTLFDLARLDEALLTFQHVLKLDLRHWDAAFRCGFTLDRLGRHAEALTYFDLSNTLKPNHAPIVQMRAMVLQKLKRLEEALPESLRAYELDPGRADTCNNIGAVLQLSGRDEEALAWFDKALALQPDFMTALSNKASSLQQVHRFDEAVATYHYMKTIDPGYALADWDLALIDMRAGNFEAGWAGREARWKAHQVNYPKFAQPMWLGQENIAGKTILICSDEGLGDLIQFARYVPMVAARGARVILVLADAAYSLLSALPGVSESFRKSDQVFAAFDMHCPTSSLPLAFGTRLDTIPADIPYLPAPTPSRVQAWEDRLGPRSKLRVGLVWSGNPNHSNDHNRSVPLQTFTRILDLDASFVSLQKGAKPADQEVLAQTEIIDLTTELTDFNETAALIACLDLVITVDTSVAHLAGAMGCPTWILLPYTPDYRWLLDRADSPWYPTVRLFRQTAARDYAQVLDRVRTELLALCARG